jgi:dolichyl-phosphate-mannose--protein O-mannosyl transferase
MRRISPYFYAMLGIFLLSLGLRFWGLARFNTLVFDEVYYAKYANYYLIGQDFFNSHPPLSQYLIAFSIWLGSFLPADPDIINNLTGAARSTFSYRWFNAFSGSFLPLVVGAIAYQLRPLPAFSLLAALLTALEGLFLVESRYSLNNIYLVLFGLLGHLWFLLAIKKDKLNFWYLALSGIAFGCAVAVKWNGLGFLLGLFLLVTISLINSRNNPHSSLIKFIRIKPIFLLIFLILIPTLTYCILWIAHLIMNPQYNFWQVHQEIAAFHQKIGGNNPQTHPYCSPWYSWLFMQRGIAYYYNRARENGILKIYDVHALGNPLLWWLSTLTLPLTFLGITGKIKWLKQDFSYYIFCNYIANLLPWIKVTRCTFIYHYMAAYSFAILGLTYILGEYIKSNSPVYRFFVYIILNCIVLAFIYWLPIYLGLPLTEKEFMQRMLWSSWI